MVALSGAGGVGAADAEDDMHFDEMFDRRESGGSPRAAVAAEGKTRDAETAERDAARVNAFVGPTASVDQPRPAPGFGKPPATPVARKPSDPQSQPRIALDRLHPGAEPSQGREGTLAHGSAAASFSSASASISVAE